MNPSISDHAMLVLHDGIEAQRPKKQFRFINCCAEMDNFQEIVKNSWDMPLAGNPMFVVWKKLQRLQPHIGKLSKPLAEIHKKIARARNDLNKVHDTLMTDRLDAGKIHMVKKCSDNLIRLQELDDSMVRQRAKVDWLRLSDDNNKYFHASIKMRQQLNNMTQIQRIYGTFITDQLGMENEVISFYRKLMGTKLNYLEGIDTTAMRNGNQLNAAQRDMPTGHVTEEEITTTLQGIGNDKALGIDGFEAYFYKKVWNIIKVDVIAAVQEFFKHNCLYRAANCSAVTLVPKHKGAEKIKDYRPIACCSTLYKIISKILANRLSKV
ncbi:unnamed protein product [Lathyrus sativus]|nr:unnamed protein product [Lathyrus sativus]